MKKLKMLLLGLLVLAVVSPVFAGGGGQQPAAAGGPVTITFTNWVSVEEGTQAPMIAMMEAYQKENPNVTIKNQGIAVSDIVKDLIIMCTAGNSPDVSQLHSDDVISMQAARFITPLEGLLSPAFISDLYPDMYDAVGLIEGKHWAVPWANTICGLFYNKKLMAQAGLDPNKPPKNVDELTQMMRQARQRLPDDVIMLQTDTTVRTIGLHHEWPFMLAFNNGVPPYSLDGKVNYNTPGMKAYMEWIRMCVNEKLTLPGMRYGQFRPYGAQGKLLFGNDGAFFDGLVRALDETKTLTPQIMYETWGATAIPAGKDGKFRTPAVAHTLVMFDKSPNKAEVAKFMEFVVGSQWSVQNYIAPQSFTPVTKSAFAKAPEFEKNQFVAAFVKDVVPSTVTMPTGIDYTLYAEVIMAGVQEVITTNRSIDDVLAEGQRKLEALFR